MKLPIITKISDTDKIAIIIRHAERLPMKSDMGNALTAPLTEKGKEDSFSMGQNLTGFCPIVIYHSPVDRCRETALHISYGIESNHCQAKVKGHLLDLGGPYIKGDWERIVKIINTIGQPTFIRKWFNNELSNELLMPLREAAKLQLRLLYDQLKSHNASYVNVTHDWNIMIMREYFFNLRHEDIGQPDYLDGLSAYLKDDTLYLHYHEHEQSFIDI